MPSKNHTVPGTCRLTSKLTGIKMTTKNLTFLKKRRKKCMIIGIGKFSLKLRKKVWLEIIKTWTNVSKHQTEKAANVERMHSQHGAGCHMIPTRTRSQNSNDKLFTQFPGSSKHFGRLFYLILNNAYTELIIIDSMLLPWRLKHKEKWLVCGNEDYNVHS